jgi:2,5-furandicarboxylate decarboxylase 1
MRSTSVGQGSVSKLSEQMLRSVLEKLTCWGSLTECTAPVNPKFEMGAVLSYYKSEKPILFRNVTGSDVPVIGGLYGNRQLMYRLLHTEAEARFDRILGAIARPGKPVYTASAPVQEHVITRGIDLPAMFPIPISNEKDSGPYLTSGMLAYRDPDSGHTYIAVRRFQVNGGNSINVLVSPASPYLQEVLQKCGEAGKDLPCAVILGYDASLLLTSQISSSRYHLDKYELDSALRGQPLELVRCKSVDLDVPAQAEIILEGVIHPHRVGAEGPFAELMGYYSAEEDSPLIELTAVTHRDRPIFQHCFPGREEHLAYGMIKEAEIYAALRPSVDVRDVNLTAGGGHRLHAVVSLHKRSEGDGKSAVLAVLGAYKDVKHVVVVDDDVDVYDPEDVEGAIASRFQAGRDLVVVSGALGSPLEPSYHERGMSDKLGLDATKPLGNRPEYERAEIPGFDRSFDIHRYLP